MPATEASQEQQGKWGHWQKVVDTGERIAVEKNVCLKVHHKHAYIFVINVDSINKENQNEKSSITIDHTKQSIIKTKQRAEESKSDKL